MARVTSTYDSVEFATGPRLNVIIGPNGTGKSTIVCAICLGLAGRTSWLGRAQQYADYIKYGRDKGLIHLELFNADGDNWKISREIHRDNTSKWTVNGRGATQKAVEELVSRLNIQVGNLTQFLPQEKVADFAKMSNSELLENTEKAVGETEMFENHQKLKDAGTSAKQLELEHNNLGERLDLEKQKNSRIKQDVENFMEREKFLNLVKTLQMKRAWVAYEEKRLAYIETKALKERVDNEMKVARRKHAPLQAKLDKSKKEKETVDNMMKKKTRELQEPAERAKKNGEEVDNLTDKFEEVREELKLKTEQEETRKRRLRELTKQLEALQADLANTADTGDVTSLIDKANKSMREVVQQMGQVNSNGDTIRCEIDGHRRSIQGIQRELHQIRDVGNRRLEMLRNKHRHTYDAVMWLRENKQMFTGIIHEPIMLSVNMRDPRMAKYVESHISFNDMRAFVCESSEDMNKFMSIVRDKQRLKVNAVKTPSGTSLDSFRPKCNINTYKRYGFGSYLRDLFTCPEAVMKFLCVQYRVHNIPVGDSRTKDMVDTIVKNHPELGCFYTANNQYNIKKSRYDGSVSSRNTQLREASLLTASMDENKEGELVALEETEQADMQQKEDQYRDLQQRSQQMDQKLNQLRDEKKKLMSRKDIKRKLQSQIDAKQQTITNVGSETLNLAAEEEKTEKKIAEINKSKYMKLQQYSSNTGLCVKLSKEKVRLSLRHAGTIWEYNLLEAEIREQTQSLQQAEAEFERVKERLHRCRDVAKKQLDAAKQATGTGPGEELSPKLKSSFEQLPNNIADLDAKIHEHQVRADCTVQTDQQVVKEYNKRKKTIDDLEVELVNKTDQCGRHQSEIELAKQKWLDPLEILLARINKSFSYFFQCLKCVGEVDLSVPENPEEYNKYGIQIRVKFRDTEQLRELTAHHQSGGERSVATVLYMMSLQELAKCPFRCVDEINQGMDPVNERKVFDLVVRTVCQKSSSQYFLLTPKLLPDLVYVENMTVLCVFNGQSMLNHTDWKLNRFKKRRKKLPD